MIPTLKVLDFICLLLIMNIFNRLSAKNVVTRLYDGAAVHTVSHRKKARWFMKGVKFASSSCSCLGFLWVSFGFFLQSHDMQVRLTGEVYGFERAICLSMSKLLLTGNFSKGVQVLENEYVDENLEEKTLYMNIIYSFII